jgi:hypothetical protein
VLYFALLRSKLECASAAASLSAFRRNFHSYVENVLVRPRRRWEDEIKMGLTETGWGVDSAGSG